MNSSGFAPPGRTKTFMLVEPTAAAFNASLKSLGDSIVNCSKRGRSIAAITRPVWLAEFRNSLACSNSARWNCQYMINGTASTTNFAENDWNRRRSDDTDLTFVFVEPPVSKSRVVLDLRKFRIGILEFLPNSLDEGAHVRAIADVAIASHEPPTAHDIVDFAVTNVTAATFGEIRNDIEFRQSQIHICVLPKRSSRGITQSQRAVTDKVVAVLSRQLLPPRFLTVQNEFNAAK